MNYSLLIMESVGMMKMATDEGSPPGRVPEQGPHWFLVAIEACSEGTPDLGYFLEVSIFIGIFGIGLTSGGGGSLNHPRDRGPRLGRWARPHPCGRLGTLLAQLFYSGGLLLVHKKSSKIGTSIGLRLIFLFCDTLKQGKKQKLALGSGLIG